MTTTPSGPGPGPVRPAAGRLAASVRRQFVDALVPASPIGRRLAGIAVVDSLGSGMFYAGSALYFTRVVGLSAGQVGVGLSLAGLAGFLGAVPLGMLADRVRAGRVYVGLQAWRGLGYAAYCFTHSFGLFVALACCIGLADTAVPPVSQAVVSSVVSAEERVNTLAKVRAARNVGFGIGALAATSAMQTGSSLGFTLLVGGNAVSFGFCALLLQRVGVTRLTVVAATSKTRRPALRSDVRYVTAAALNGLLAIHLTLLPLALPLWISRYTDVPIGLYGPLYVLNTVMAVFLQARFSRPAERLPGAVTSMRWCGFALAGFALACWGMRQAPDVWAASALAVVAAVLVTCAEMLQSAGGWTISYDLARPDRRAQYLATFQLGTALQAIVAPALITSLVLPHTLGWPVFAVAAVAVGASIRLVVGRHAIEAHAQDPEPAPAAAPPGPVEPVAQPAPEPEPAPAPAPEGTASAPAG